MSRNRVFRRHLSFGSTRFCCCERRAIIPSSVGTTR
ncbi:hypothetical protein KP509_09G045400 [Ceratopteris richardii]|uniref:Uncharacterized protein n=1 Tax=Ceratopteris richardii TaxID=49495 RepID=A0A8T2TZX8_CERRI|nr:hypothetical protein KP509_09G045400 [Ceratopteris richardii]